MIVIPPVASCLRRVLNLCRRTAGCPISVLGDASQLYWLASLAPANTADHDSRPMTLADELAAGVVINVLANGTAMQAVKLIEPKYINPVDRSHAA